MTRGENAEEARDVVGRRGAVLEGRERRDILEFARILSIGAASLSQEIERSIHLLKRRWRKYSNLITQELAGSLKQFLHTICRKILFLLDKIMNNN